MQLRAVRSRWPQVRLAGVVLGTALAACWLRGPILLRLRGNPAATQICPCMFRADFL